MSLLNTSLIHVGKKYGTGAALSLLNGNVGREVLAFHKKITQLCRYAVT